MSKWFEQAAFYHIYPLGLCGAPAVNPGGEPVHRFLELEKWLPHIEKLGCGGIYIGPLFQSGTHGYDTMDYKLVDGRLGDNEDFRRFVEKAHSFGIRVVVDGVFNHTGKGFFAFEDIRKNREHSPYCGWYKGLNFQGSCHGESFGYESWRNCGDLANLNLQNPEVKEYLFEVIRFWIREFDIDGIRLDCADCLEFDFMRQLRQLTGREKEDFWLMGEVIHGDYSRWANEEMLHSVTNYELHKGLYSGHNDHNYFEIAHTIRRQFDENGGIYRGRILYSFADNHDVSRLVNKLKNKEHLKPVYGLLYTLPGIPSVYYGSEWGIEGAKEQGDAALRPCLDLEEFLKRPPVPGLAEWIAFLGNCRKEYLVLAEGRYRELLLTNRQYAFVRMDEGRGVITAVNNDESDAELWIPLPLGGSLMDLETKEQIEPEGGKLHITLSAGGCRLIGINV